MPGLRRAVTAQICVKENLPSSKVLPNATIGTISRNPPSDAVGLRVLLAQGAAPVLQKYTPSILKITRKYQ